MFADVVKSSYICKSNMKKLFYIASIVLALTTVMGCGHNADKRLVLADTLMWTRPDSSLAILNGVCRDSLTDDEDLAYHALLLTQAQFRCHGNCDDSTLIESTLSHYSANHNSEHYTRALLYKGAIHEERKEPVEAMKCYKLAEANAPDNDYRNLAQLNMRMGMLYYKNYASNNLDLEKFKKSLHYYSLINDEKMIMFCHGMVGNLLRETQKKQAINHLEKAKSMAMDRNDTASYYTYLNDLSMAYFFDSLFVKSKDAAMECVNNITPATNAMLFNAVNAYAVLGHADSARHLMADIDTVAMSDYDRMMLAYAKGYVYKAESNERNALYYQNLGTAISDTIILKSSRTQIFETENVITGELETKNAQKMYEYKKLVLVVVVVLISLILFLFVMNIVKNRKYRRLINDLRTNQFYTQELLNETTLAYQQINQEKKQHNLLKEQNNIQKENIEYLNRYFNSFNSLLNKCYSVNRFDFISELESIIKEVSVDDKYWDIIMDVANKKTLGFLSELINDIATLNQSEIRILSLVCLGYNNDAIAASTGYAKDSIKTIKTRIRNKINADMNLVAYINHEVSKRQTAS